MCIAIYKPENIYVKKHTLQTCFNNHPDGAGFMVFDHKEGRLIVEKGFFSFRKFWKAYKKYKFYRAVIHFRYSTAGKIDHDNCHPFLVNENLGFVHNGTLSVRMDKKEFSDTWHFNEHVLKSIVNDYPNAWMHKTMKQLIESFLTERNKLVFMDNEGNVTIYNEQLGTWDAECWFSNDTYKKQMVRKRYAEGATGQAGKGTCATNACGATTATKGTYYSTAANTTPRSTNTNRSSDEVLLESLMAEAEAEELGELAANRGNVTPDVDKTLINLGKDNVDTLAEDLNNEIAKQGDEVLSAVVGEGTVINTPDGKIDIKDLDPIGV